MSMVSRLVALALFERGLILGDLDRLEDALTAYEEVVRRFGDSHVPALLGCSCTGARLQRKSYLAV